MAESSAPQGPIRRGETGAQLILTRRAFNTGVVAAAAAALLPMPARATVPPKDEALVLARATEVDLSAQETAVVLAPVPQRRPPQQRKLAKGEKPPAPRTWIVLRDVIAAERAPAYDLFLVLEGTNVFAPTTTAQPIGALALKGGSGDEGKERRETVAFDVTEPLTKLSKTRGFNMRFLRLTIVRRAVKDDSGKETVPNDPRPPEIGTIELVRW
ncbi:MAG: hypothetical protein K2Y71_02930 [Xanthobacteraceae bacterium]|nr:hypothetical protein [Xanthobacteraceae bacterium]